MKLQIRYIFIINFIKLNKQQNYRRMGTKLHHYEISTKRQETKGKKIQTVITRV